MLAQRVSVSVVYQVMLSFHLYGLFGIFGQYSSHRLAANDRQDETLTSRGPYLCRCELRKNLNVVAQRDCVRHSEGTGCRTAAEIQSYMDLVASKLGEPSLRSEAGIEVECYKITIDGNRVKSQTDVFRLPGERPLPNGVTDCSPKHDTPKSISPFTAFASYLKKLKGLSKLAQLSNLSALNDDPSVPSPTLKIDASIPDKLFATCDLAGGTSPGKFCDGDVKRVRCCGATRAEHGLCQYDTIVGHSVVGMPRRLSKFKKKFTSFWKSTPIYAAVPEAVLESLLINDKDPNSACCSGKVIFTRLGQWECREDTTLESLLWQMYHVSSAFSRYAFAQYLMQVYNTKVRPVEKAALLDQIGEGGIMPGELTAKPMVLLFGSYSTGKSTFIKNMAGRTEDLPGMITGVEPTTAKFMVIQQGDEGTVPGSVLVSDENQPFTALKKFGNVFLDRFAASRVPSTKLKDITFVDTPGVLSGKTQKNRGYDYNGVMQWFADRAKVILLFFDVAKIDISDELGELISLVTKSHPQKVKIVLNKADLIPADSLTRVYGSLLWGLKGKLNNQVEAPKIYIGNFGSRDLFPYREPDGKPHEYLNLFEREYKALMSQISDACSLEPSLASTLGFLINQINRVRVHGYLMQQLHKSMPKFTKGAVAKARLLEKLNETMHLVAQRRGCPYNDFEDPSILKNKLLKVDFNNVAADLEEKLLSAQEATTMIEPLQGKIQEIFGAETDRASDAKRAESS